MPNKLYERATEIGKSIGRNIDQAGKMKKINMEKSIKNQNKEKDTRKG